MYCPAWKYRYRPPDSCVWYKYRRRHKRRLYKPTNFDGGGQERR